MWSDICEVDLTRIIPCVLGGRLTVSYHCTSGAPELNLALRSAVPSFETKW